MKDHCEKCKSLEKENARLKNKVVELQELLQSLFSRIESPKMEAILPQFNSSDKPKFSKNHSRELSLSEDCLTVTNISKGFYSRIALLENSVPKVGSLSTKFKVDVSKGGAFEIGFAGLSKLAGKYDENLIGGSEIRGRSLLFSGGQFKKMENGNEEIISLGIAEDVMSIFVRVGEEGMFVEHAGTLTKLFEVNGQDNHLAVSLFGKVIISLE